MGKIAEYRSSKNIVELLDEETLDRISEQVLAGYQLDLDSRSEWETIMEKALKLTKQVFEPKSRPNMAKAANVKYPLITTAAIEFASRVYPEIIQSGRVVHAKVIGRDPGFIKSQQATRVSKHMSYQLLEESPEWEDSVDKMLHMLPIFGTVFKKIFFDPIKGRNVSVVVPPEDLVVNQNIFSLDEARRVTHRLHMHNNDIVERVRMGLFTDIGELQPSIDEKSKLEVDPGEEPNVVDRDAPVLLLEQHTYVDLDGDGYDEPYVVTVHKDSGEVLRIVHRFKEVKMKDEQVVRINPENFFVDFHYIRNPDGGFYSIGLGTLLTPINESVNTILNQLIDSGTLANQQSGFVGKGLRLKNGQVNVENGQWTVLDTGTGVDIKNNIVPLPTKEPSPTLFNLLGLLIEAGRDIASVNDVLQGKQPAQNVPATTVLTLVEQGLKVFNSIVKRIYRSMKQEFARLFELNRRHVSDIDYQNVLDDELASVRFDYDMKSLDIAPVADPSVSSDAQRLARARALMEIPTLDPFAVSKIFLEALQIDESLIEVLLPLPDPNAPPPPESQKTIAETDKIRAETQEIIAKQQQAIIALQIQASDADARSKEAEGRIAKMIADAQNNAQKLRIVSDKSAVETEIKSRGQIQKELTDERILDQKELDLIIKAAQVDSNDRNTDR